MDPETKEEKSPSASEDILYEIRDTVDALEKKLKPVLLQIPNDEAKEMATSSILVKQLQSLKGDLNQLLNKIDL